MKITLDHVGVVGREMEPLLGWARGLGFTPTEPKPLFAAPDETGKREPLGQTSAHIVLEHGYIELSAVEDPSVNRHLGPYLKHREGLLILAFGCDDLDQARTQCKGYDPSPLQHASREITYGKKHGWAKFDWFMLAPKASPDGLVCFVRPHDKALIYQPEVTSHPNNATALTGVDVFAGNSDTEKRYRRLLGDEALAEAGINFVGADYPGNRPALSSQRPAMVGFHVRRSHSPTMKMTCLGDWPCVTFN